MDAGTRLRPATLESSGTRPGVVHVERPVAPTSLSSILIFAGCGYATAYFIFRFARGELGWDGRRRMIVRRHPPVQIALALIIQGWVAFAGLQYLSREWYGRVLWLGVAVTGLLLLGIWRQAVHEEHRRKREEHET